MKLTDFLQDVGRPVAYYPSLRKLTGSTNATIFLCQLLYWKGKEADPEGWIHKTAEEMEQETGLSYEEQKTARAKLKSKGFLEEHYARLDHQMKYRLNTEIIDQDWRTWQSHVREEGNPSFGNEAIPHSLNGITETTTETTSQIEEVAAVPPAPVVDGTPPVGSNGVIVFGKWDESLDDIHDDEKHFPKCGVCGHAKERHGESTCFAAFCNCLGYRQLKGVTVEYYEDDHGQPGKKIEKQPTAQQKMVETLSLITGIDYHIPSNAKRLGKVASDLSKGGYTHEDVKVFKTWWYLEDWRGKKGEAPKLAQVSELIGIPRNGVVRELKGIQPHPPKLTEAELEAKRQDVKAKRMERDAKRAAGVVDEDEIEF